MFYASQLEYIFSLAINDSSFERASVLFNCGALMSAIASVQQVHTDEELKSMAKLFQQAAGVFAKLKDSVLGLVTFVIVGLD
jgi:programmed cell death 6-interacting protein